MGNLFEDLTTLIIESHPHLWPRDLARLALVSTAWLGPARARLYTAPVLTSHRSCFFLARTLAANPALARLVRSLDLQPKVHSWQENDESGYCDGVPSLLSLTSPKSLTLGGDLSSNAEQYLRAISNPHALRTLRIVNTEHSYYADLALEWDCELAVRFRGLKRLDFAGPFNLDVIDSFSMIFGNNASKVPLGCQIEELFLGEIAAESSFLPNILTKSDSWERLRSLHIAARDGDCDEQHFILLNLPLPSLEFFTYELATTIPDVSCLFMSVEDTDESIASLPPFSAVRHVRLLNVGLLPNSIPVICRAFPNIESLEVSQLDGLDIPLHNWSRLIKECELPALKKLVLKEGGRKSSHAVRHATVESMKELKDLCTERRVDLLCDLEVDME